MLDFLPAPLKGILAVLLILINTLLFLPLLLLVALAKLVVPVQPFRKACTIVLNAIAWYWIGFNNTLMNLLHRVEWEVRGAEELSKEHWYFVTCNHQSWADIPAIQYVLNSKIPLLKFFLKKTADLGAFVRSCLVGSRFPVYAQTYQGTDRQTPGTERQGHRSDKGRL